MALTTFPFLAAALLATIAVNVAAIKECVKLPSPKDGEVQSVLSKSGQKLAIFMCNERYAAAGDTILSCVNGKWDKTPPFCSSLEDCELEAPDAIPQIYDRVHNCPSLTSPKNGRMDNDLIGDFTQRATFICRKGYKLVGPNKLNCEQGQWNGVEPVCQPEDCSVPEAPENGTVYFKDTHFMAKARYECDECHIRRGVEWRRCKPSGTWSKSTPECVPVTDVCILPDLEVPNGGYIVNRRALEAEEMTCGQTVQIQCFVGFRLDGSDTALCNSKGAFEWIGGAQPTCTRARG